MSTQNLYFKKIGSADAGEPHAGYGGIAWRCLWFWLVCFGGVAVYRYVPLPIAHTPLLVAAAILALVCPVVACMVPGSTPVFGSIYSFVQGFLLAQVCSVYAGRYAGIVWLAAGFTVLVFLVCLLLYRTGIIQPDSRLRGVVWTLFIASVVASGIVYISSLFTTALTSIFWNNGPLSIIVSAGALLIAAVNLVYEFDLATGLVQRGFHKKYEWVAAYGLFMSVIMIFLRVFELLAKTNTAKGGK